MDFYLAKKSTKLSEVVNIAGHRFHKDLGCSETRGLLCSSGNVKVKFCDHCMAKLIIHF